MVVCGKQIRVGGRIIRIARLDAEKYLFLENPAPVVEELRRSGVRVDLFTFMQRLPETSPKFHYPMEWDNLAVLPVSTFDHWWNEQIGFKARNKAKQAEKKGVELRQVPFGDALVQGIHAIYNESPVRQGRVFRHFGKDLETVRQEEGTYLDHSTFIAAFFKGTMIGFIKLVSDETCTQAGLMNIVSMISHREKAPTNALIAHAVRACAARGVRYLVYSNFAYARKERDGLSDFKERSGFQRVDLPRYYVPLTRTGLAALRLGLHKNIVDYLPESLLARLRNLRSVWNNRKLHTVADA